MTPNGTKLALLVSADPGSTRLAASVTARGRWRITTAVSSDEVAAVTQSRDDAALDAIIVDLADRHAVIAELRRALPEIPIIAHCNIVENAVKALHAGANDYLIRPVSAERCLAALEATLALGSFDNELCPLSEKLSAPMGFGDIVGSDPQFRNALAIAAKGARARVPILIEGEPGVGIDTVAAAIHATSPRDKRPFIRFDCATIAPNQIEAELFGHAKNAFTGAFMPNQGRISAANSGTLFIDNVDLLPLSAQVRLLRLLDRQEVQALGSNRPESVDVRLISATNTNLAGLVKAEQFREDLHDKLNTVHITLPALCQRSGDLPSLARHLLAKIASLPAMRDFGVTDATMELLSAYSWPGNVRQLESTLLRAAITCEGDALTTTDFPIIAKHVRYRKLPANAAHSLSGGVTLFEPNGHMRPLNAIEADVVRLAIGHYRGRMAEVARRLGIGRSTLYRKLAELGITDVA